MSHGHTPSLSSTHLRRLVVACLALAFGGCEPVESAPSSAGSSSADSLDARPSPVAEKPAEPKRKPVTADSYANIDSALAALAQAASERDQDEQLRADEWLRMQGDAAVEPLSQVVLDEEADLAFRVVACRPLRALGPAARPAFLTAIESPQQLVRLNAMKGLGMIRPVDLATVPLLQELIDHDDLQTQRIAILSLGLMGSAAEAAAPQLLEILNSQDASETLRTEAKRSLVKISPRRTLQD